MANTRSQSMQQRSDPRRRLKIAVVAAGAVGGYFGARLASAGEEVHFLARGEHLSAIRQHGLRVDSQAGNIHLFPANATDDANAIGPVDVVLFAVKLWDTASAAEQCRPLLKPDTLVITFQNGVEAVDQIAAVLGAQHVMGGVALISAVIGAPGRIDHTGKLARLTFGEMHGAMGDRALPFLEACRNAAFDVEFSRNMERQLWRKFTFLVGISAMTCATRLPIGPVLADPGTFALLRKVMEEVAALSRAEGVDSDPDFVDELMNFCQSLAPDVKASMLKDLERGGRMELNWLSGAVVRRAARAGVATPANALIFTLLKPHAMGRRN